MAGKFMGQISIRHLVIVFLLGAATLAQAQWRMQASGTKAGLRGIHAVDANTAWASGTNGTILRTTDGGRHWRHCSVPPGAAKLDFRAVWGWNADEAMAMSSGPGKQSRLYATDDGCQSWKLTFTNPDANGFWDALQFSSRRFGAILGDPVDGRFTLFATYDGGRHWTRQVDACLRAEPTAQGAFAASNQALAVLPLDDRNAAPGFSVNHQIWFGTGGGWIYGFPLAPLRLIAVSTGGCVHTRVLSAAPADNSATGVFAIAFRDPTHGVAVGGNYAKPGIGTATAAYTTDGVHWKRALQPPAGYRSTVVWNGLDGAWIAAGSTGSDVSRDGGKTWSPLGHAGWNALSLPFAVGADGRIGRLISWGELRAEERVPAHRVLARSEGR